MSKYKYYFRKPRSEIIKDIFYCLAISGMICFAATSPYFGINLMRGLKKWLRNKKYQKEKIYNAFWRLKKEGCIKTEIKNHQIYIHLTEKGKRKANWFQIDFLKITPPKKWDKKWRLVIFDIAQLKKNYRESFRGKLKELGFYPLQKSVWIHPFDCKDEINLLKNFFGLNDKELRLIIAENIGSTNSLNKHFRLFI